MQLPPPGPPNQSPPRDINIPDWMLALLAVVIAVLIGYVVSLTI